MTQLFIAVLSLSLSGTITGLLIAATHLLTHKYFSKKWNYYIWLLVIVQLLIPSGLLHRQINLNLPAAGLAAHWHLPELADLQQIPAIQAAPADLKHTQAGTSTPINKTQDIDTANKNSFENANNITADKSSFKNTRQTINPFTVANLFSAAAYVWFLGFIISLFVMLLNYFLYQYRLKKTCSRIMDTSVTMMENAFCARLHIQNAPALYESTAVSSPVTIGLLRPVIVLPETFSDNRVATDTVAYSGENLSKLQLVLHHELIHVARKDLLYKWLCQLLLCVHWFNPILRQIGRQINRDCELSCDEAILTVLTPDGRQLYGNILLDTAELEIRRKNNALATTLLENKKDLKGRLDNILHSHTPTRLQLALSLITLLIMFVLSACGTVWISAKDAPASESRADETDSEPDYRGSIFPKASDSAVTDPQLTAALPDIPAAQKTDADPDRSKDVESAFADDKLLAGEDIQVYMVAYTYIGGNRKLRASHLYLHGSDTIVIVYAERDVDVQIKTSFTVSEGKFKVVSIAPDGSVTTLNETGKETWNTITLHKGRNAIKMIGLEAHLENLLIDYSDLNESHVRKIYHSEGEEYAIQLLDRIAAGEYVSKDKFFDAIIYMNSADVSEVFNALLSSGTTFTDEELYNIFIYSDDTLSSRYFLNAVQTGTTAAPSAATILKLMPYLLGDCQTELLKSLSVEEFYDTFAESIYYLDSDQIEECLTDYLDRGGVLTYTMYDEISPYLNKDISQKLDTRLHP